jgi:hypothetical protein
MSMAARPEGESELQRQLRDLVCLAVVGDHVRWVVRDDAEIRDWLAEASGDWRLWADQVAHRLMAAGIAPDGRIRSLVKDLPLNWVPEGWLSGDDARRLIVGRLALVAEWARYRNLHAESADAELLNLVATGLETQMRALRQGATNHRNREGGSQTAAERTERTDGGR